MCSVGVPTRTRLGNSSVYQQAIIIDYYIQVEILICIHDVFCSSQFAMGNCNSSRSSDVMYFQDGHWLFGRRITHLYRWCTHDVTVDRSLCSYIS